MKNSFVKIIATLLIGATIYADTILVITVSANSNDSGVAVTTLIVPNMKTCKAVGNDWKKSTSALYNIKESIEAVAYSCTDVIK